jgi:hypothetical protein
VSIARRSVTGSAHINARFLSRDIFAPRDNADVLRFDDATQNLNLGFERAKFFRDMFAHRLTFLRDDFDNILDHIIGIIIERVFDMPFNHAFHAACVASSMLCCCTLSSLAESFLQNRLDQLDFRQPAVVSGF